MASWVWFPNNSHKIVYSSSNLGEATIKINNVTLT